MQKRKTHYLSNGLSTLAILSILLLSNTAYAHQGLFTHTTIDSYVLHFLFHGLMMISLGVAVFFISRYWLRRTKTTMNKTIMNNTTLRIKTK